MNVTEQAEARMREFTCSWCNATPGHPCRTGWGLVLAKAHSYRRKAATGAGRLPIQTTDDYLAIVERQRAEALAEVERLNQLVHRIDMFGDDVWKQLLDASDKIIALRTERAEALATIERVKALASRWEGGHPESNKWVSLAALRGALATVRGQADAETEEGS